MLFAFGRPDRSGAGLGVQFLHGLHEHGGSIVALRSRGAKLAVVTGPVA
jgi:hypothetical protein